MTKTSKPAATNDPLNQKRLNRAESARINGAKSKGPKTPEGKARSSKNALRHGLTSKRIMPLVNTNGERIDYEHHLRGLKAEFDPQTPMQLHIVETLARDLVCHGRTGQMEDTVLQPYYRHGFDKPSQTLSELLYEHDALEAALAFLDSHDRIDLEREQRVVVRARILTVSRTVGRPADTDVTATAKQLHEIGVDPGFLRLHDPARLMDVLAGKIELTDKELKQWVSLLQPATERCWLGRPRSRRLPAGGRPWA